MDAGWRAVPLPTLVIEVTSDSTRRRDRVHKRNLYAELGIPEYWIVDREDRSVRIVRQGQPDVVATESIAWHSPGMSEPLGIELADVFGPPPGDRSSDSR